ncbi:MAG: aminotransferase class I/II-fold pyridoxal phosphate-dependent enzyme [Elusimicrobia bacterium]|nr:aminotransferase class I/II-fold pyridoxal phosphate-dependent enzyme [Elusimicrobiota bacterium]MBK7687869.1 aminotransferase class I/II-fold pyridoxal phosphate-dependent enzyme [Elusimicrobiota bacterium]MBK8125212.1 aminotransferase class I/II-fold pyridoxal phosphate-dependent enzyme [Elusimicrobiota bacterium]MBK8424100.1 aminotransferase class I/II-fold pyridoxal phosphate-dependent enzyme [Elusimicrobiota bacterium]MBK9057704.1 aminotransferase class I/II-fold pyridoxal phosphate-dep
MSDAGSLDRRKSIRFAPPVGTLLTILTPENEFGLVTTISKQGLGFSCVLNEVVGAYVKMKLDFPNFKQFELEGRVAWKSNGNTGLAIMDRKDAADFQLTFDQLEKQYSVDRRAVENKNATGDEGRTEGQSKDRRGVVNIFSRTFAQNFGLDRWGSYYAYERVTESSTGNEVVLNTGRAVMLGSNNYLGLTNHPKVKEATIKAIERYGTGSGGARVLSGTTDIHRKLEEKIAQFKGVEAALVFSTGYLANVAVFTSLLKSEDIVFNDQLNHASIIDGSRMSPATIRFYKHSDVLSLEKKMSQYPYDRPKMIVTDGVFSMDGDIAPLDRIVPLAKKHNALVMVDDAHAIGVIGPNGRGTAAHFGMTGKVDIIIATFSKALGAMGGAVCGSKSLIKFINHHSRQFIFSTAIVPSACATVLAALEVLEEDPGIVLRLHSNKQYLAKGLREMGFNVIDAPTAIVPVFIGDERKTYAMTHLLGELGVFVNAVSRPSVPRELSRIRITPMATHTQAQLSFALDAFHKAGKKLSII